MCFRLLAAIRSNAKLSPENQFLEATAFRCGLDVRVAPRGITSYVELAWGDCACSLYTRREGWERVAKFVDQVMSTGSAVQLLLYSDGDEFDAQGEPRTVAYSELAARGLSALPERQVCLLQ